MVDNDEAPAAYTVLNLGCGDKVSGSPNVINVDHSYNLMAKKYCFVRWAAMTFLRGQRLERVKRDVAGEFRYLYWNVKRGLPFEDSSVDAVYHSHLIEHLDRGEADMLLGEIYRVLKKGGVHRVAAPDLAYQCRKYLAHYDLAVVSPEEAPIHAKYIEELIGLLVDQGGGPSGKKGLAKIRSIMENWFAKSRGHRHKWMYDGVSAVVALGRYGYERVYIANWNESEIAGWKQYALELDASGGEWRPDSFYVEAAK